MVAMLMEGDTPGWSRGAGRLKQDSWKEDKQAWKHGGRIEALIARVSVENRCPPCTFPTLWAVHRRTLCRRDLGESSRLLEGHRVKWDILTV